MRLLYITNGITGVGGLERVLSIKATYFADKYKYDVHILSLNEKGKTPFYQFSSRINFHSLEVGHSPIKYFQGISKLVSILDPDIISVCDDGFKGLLAPLWIRGRSKIIYERHVSKEILTEGKQPNMKQKIMFWIMGHCVKLFDKFIILTNDSKREWQGDNVSVIPNPLSFYPPDVSSLDHKRIIAVGKVSIQKGYDRLNSAWSLIQSKFPEWKIDIFGYAKDYEQANKDINNNTIKIHPPTSNIIDEYLTSSIYALPSRFEGFGMVLIEAMACGVPCVAFDCPCGPRDIIKDGEDGFLVENGNIEQFAERLSQLIENEELRHSMGAKARANVKRYDIEIIANMWDKLFKELCSKTNR